MQEDPNGSVSLYSGFSGISPSSVKSASQRPRWHISLSSLGTPGPRPEQRRTKRSLGESHPTSQQAGRHRRTTARSAQSPAGKLDTSACSTSSSLLICALFSSTRGTARWSFSSWMSCLCSFRKGMEGQGQAQAEACATPCLALHLSWEAKELRETHIRNQPKCHTLAHLSWAVSPDNRAT